MVSIRPAQASDAPALTAINVLGWQQAYRGIVPEEALAQMSPANPKTIAWWESYIQQLPATDLVLVAEEDGVIGYINLSQDPEETKLGIELRRFYIHPNHWRSGIGSLLMQAAVTHLQSQGWPGLYLWTLRDSILSRRFYEKRGGRLTPNAEKTFARPGFALPMVQYTWSTPADFTA